MKTSYTHSAPTPYAEATCSQARVIGALILRDMRTRFGRRFFDYATIAGRILSLSLIHMIASMHRNVLQT